MLLVLVAQRITSTNAALAEAAPRGIDCRVATPEEAVALAGPGDAVVGRLDVRPSLDGVDDGLWALGSLRARGIPTLNPASALLGAHDKLLTSRILLRAGLPHPRTRLLLADEPVPELVEPVVVKPRFGSWGQGVALCRDTAELRDHVAGLAGEPWFRVHGALLQQLVPPQGHDLRVVVAGGKVVGAVQRIAAAGEWRTNVALGAERRPLEPPAAARVLALDAAAAAGTHFVGVDILPDGSGGWVVLELNGAVELTPDYALDHDPFEAAVWELARAGRGCGGSSPDVHGTLTGSRLRRAGSAR